jgi:type II secretory pathway predicted ATPase ExeA
VNFLGKNVVVRELHYENGAIDITAVFVDDAGITHGAIRHRIPQPVEVGDPETDIHAIIRKAIEAIQAWVIAKHFEGSTKVRGEDAPKLFGIAETLESESDPNEYDPA